MPAEPAAGPEPPAGAGPASPLASPPASPPVRWHRPKTERFRALSILWWFPSAGALVILGSDLRAWRAAESWGTALAGTRLEQWVALGLLLLHPVLFALARHYHRVERPVALPPEEPEEPEEVDEKIQ